MSEDKIIFNNIYNIPNNFTGTCDIGNVGNTYYFKNGEYHREDGPAVEYKNGNKKWYLNGRLHREDGPAVEWTNGKKEWFQNGKLHRTDGPAVEHTDGSKEWWLNDYKHRLDGPAIERANGDKMWYVSGIPHREGGPAIEDGYSKSWIVSNQYHRLDGPAIEYKSGSKLWYINGWNLSEEQFNKKISNMPVIHSINDVSTYFTGTLEMGGNKFIYKNGKLHSNIESAVKLSDGTKIWYQDNLVHRSKDAPAVESSNYYMWVKNGLIHRTGGPAVEYKDGTKYWYLNGQLHRENGPAIEYTNGIKEWWINNQKYTEEEFKNLSIKRFKSLKEIPENFTGVCKIVSKIYTYKDGKKQDDTFSFFRSPSDIPKNFTGKCYIFQHNDVYHYKNGNIHREDGPAIEYADGSKSWWINNKKHRTDGPAMEYANGDKEWFINDMCHRIDGPAVEHANGNKEWLNYGKCHRLDGPAIECADGTKYWFIDAKPFTEVEFNDYLKNISSDNLNIENQKVYLSPEDIYYSNLDLNTTQSSKFNFKNVGYRILIDQITNSIRYALKQILNNNNHNNDKSSNQILDSEFGKALIQASLSLIAYQMNEENFCHELMVASISTSENSVIDFLTSKLTPSVQSNIRLIETKSLKEAVKEFDFEEVKDSQQQFFQG